MKGEQKIFESASTPTLEDLHYFREKVANDLNLTPSLTLKLVPSLTCKDVDYRKALKSLRQLVMMIEHYEDSNNNNSKEN
jgi:hypothetical protein